MILIGLIVVAVGGFAIYSWYQQVEREKKLKKLLIITNSGQIFSIYVFICYIRKSCQCGYFGLSKKFFALKIGFIGFFRAWF